MLEIVIKHLKLYLYIFWGEPFFLLTSGWLLLLTTSSLRLLLQSTAFQHCEYLYRILHDMCPNQWNVIFKPMLMKTKGPHRWRA